MTAREIVAARKGRWHGAYGTARCPAHEDREPSLSIRDGINGEPVFNCFAGCDWREIKDALRADGLLPERADIPALQPRRYQIRNAPRLQSDDSDREQRRIDFRAAAVAGEKLLGLYGEADGAVPQNARWRYNSAKAAKPKPRGISREADAVWGAALRLDGSMGGRYLEENRRCGIPGHHCCRYVPALKHILSSRIFPCIVSLVTDVVTGAPLTLHMTFLALDGRAKAPVKPSRLFWPGLPVGGGVVRLSADDEVETGLAIAEGLEDGQSLVDHGVRPVWACLSAGAMANFPVLAGVEALTICADSDDAGRRAAAKCMERWTAAGREVTVTFPHGAAKDFNEVAVSRASA